MKRGMSARAAIVALVLHCSGTFLAHAAPEMVFVGPGSFVMGKSDAKGDAGPERRVTISRGFYMAARELSFAEYYAFCEKTGRPKPKNGPGNERYATGPELPVRSVTWQDAVDYCNWLSLGENLQPCYSGRGKTTICDFGASGYRLPTEAEWEYAARGGPSAGASGSLPYAGFSKPDGSAWYSGNSGNETHPVGTKKPNILGLYDMCGNMFEWCWDWYDSKYYAVSPATDPKGPPAPDTSKPWLLTRVRRSGSWRESAESVAVWSRSYDGMTYVGDNGFRVVRSAP